MDLTVKTPMITSREESQTGRKLFATSKLRTYLKGKVLLNRTMGKNLAYNRFLLIPKRYLSLDTHTT